MASVDTADEAALRDCELTGAIIEMRLGSMDGLSHQDGRRARGIAPSLVSLDIDRGIVRAPDPMLRLKFDRYHLSIQALCDAGARIEAARPNARQRTTAA